LIHSQAIPPLVALLSNAEHERQVGPVRFAVQIWTKAFLFVEKKLINLQQKQDCLKLYKHCC